MPNRCKHLRLPHITWHPLLSGPYLTPAPPTPHHKRRGRHLGSTVCGIIADGIKSGQAELPHKGRGASPGRNLQAGTCPQACAYFPTHRTLPRRLPRLWVLPAQRTAAANCCTGSVAVGHSPPAQPSQHTGVHSNQTFPFWGRKTLKRCPESARRVLGACPAH